MANCLRFIRCRVLIEFMATNCVAVYRGCGAVIREGCIDREWILSSEMVLAGHFDYGIDRLQQKRCKPAATAGHGWFFKRWLLKNLLRRCNHRERFARPLSVPNQAAAFICISRPLNDLFHGPRLVLS